MYGTSTGKLEVYLKTVSDYNETLIWKQETGLPREWFSAQIDVMEKEDFQVSGKNYLELVVNLQYLLPTANRK